MKKRWILLTLALMLAGCASAPEATPSTQAPTAETTEPVTQATTEPTLPPDPVELLMDAMTVEEKVGQIFLARFPGETAAQDAAQYHLGGFILFAQDFENRTPEDVQAMIAACQESVQIPMLMAVDEEGGIVTRISNYPAFRWEPFPSPRELFGQGGMDLALSVETEKAILLSSLGLNVNMGPVCDITTAPRAFMYQRSLGQDAETTAEFAAECVRRMEQYGVGSVLKHFPGYGANGDTHTGRAVDKRSLPELEAMDLVPFMEGVHAGPAAIMMSHNTVLALDEQMPVSLSPAAHTYLRDTLGFEGVIVTDELSMGAVSGVFDSSEAAVLAVLAGNDLLCATDYATQYEAVLGAVQDGRIELWQLDEAVCRVLRWKQQLGLLENPL